MKIHSSQDLIEIDKIKLYKAKASDMMDVFELANDPEVRQNSFNQEQISLDDHTKWFLEKLNNLDCLILIVKNSQKEFVGSVRFELDSKKITNTYIISIQISKQFRGRKLANHILKSAIFEFSKTHNNCKIIAKIKNSNLASVKIFNQNNFLVINNNQSKDYILLEHNLN